MAGDPARKPMTRVAFSVIIELQFNRDTSPAQTLAAHIGWNVEFIQSSKKSRIK